jgi:hypothetical protein
VEMNSLKWCMWVLFMCLAFAGIPLRAQDRPLASPGPVSVLFVGNSLTYYNAMPSLVAEVLRNSNPSLRIQSELLAQGGAHIRDHLNAGVLERTLRLRHFNVVVFQELGGFPECPSDFPGCLDSPDAVTAITALIRKYGARPIWFSTWQSSQVSQLRLSNRASSLAHGLRLEMVDVGATLTRYSELEPEAEVLRSDGHPQPLGSWIAAEVIARAIRPLGSPGTASMKACGPDWASHDLKLSSLASSQQQPAQRCFRISADEMRTVNKLVHADG